MRKLQTTELNRLSIEAFKSLEKLPVVVVLDNLRSGHNVGSVFRTCDAFAVSCLYLCGITPTPPNREVKKTALGGSESVNWHYFEDTLKALEKVKEDGFQIIIAEHTTRSISLQHFSPSKNMKYALVFGNEIDGISGDLLELADAAVEIPQFGTKHSLNFSIAAGIILWHFARNLLN